MENKGKLALKIVQVGNEMRGIRKDGDNDFSKYNYISYEMINAQISKALMKYKIAVIPSITNITKESFKSNKGKLTTTFLLEIEFEIIDAETGYSFMKKWYAEGSDTNDKALAKALTEGSKRFYAKLFNITSGEVDPDRDTIDMEPEETKEERFKSRVNRFINANRKQNMLLMEQALFNLGVKRILETTETEFFIEIEKIKSGAINSGSIDDFGRV